MIISRNADKDIALLMDAYANIIQRVTDVTQHCKSKKIDEAQRSAMIYKEIQFWFINYGELKKPIEY